MLRYVAFAFLFALAAAGIFVLVRFTHDLSEAHRRLAGRSQTIETSFGQLEYAAVGSGAGVLVVHGASGGFDQSLDMTGTLAHQGFRVIAPSRFGYLRSAMPSHPTLASQADAYAELLDRLHVGKVVVVGISAGAWSSLEFAIRHPEHCRGLVLLVPANYLPPNTKISRRPCGTGHFRIRFRRLGCAEADATGTRRHGGHHARHRSIRRCQGEFE